jgi:hypothetical protein
MCRRATFQDEVIYASAERIAVMKTVWLDCRSDFLRLVVAKCYVHRAYLMLDIVLLSNW